MNGEFLGSVLSILDGRCLKGSLTRTRAQLHQLWIAILLVNIEGYNSSSMRYIRTNVCKVATCVRQCLMSEKLLVLVEASLLRRYINAEDGLVRRSPLALALFRRSGHGL